MSLAMNATSSYAPTAEELGMDANPAIPEQTWGSYWHW